MNFTNGTTEGFSITLECLLSQCSAQNGKDNALIVPMPNYGLFIDIIEKRGIKVIGFAREPDGSVDAGKLAETIEQNREDYNILAYFDSNPNNPTGHVRQHEETEALARVISEFNKSMEGDFRNNSPIMQVIDDMVYLGTEYGPEKPSSFLGVPDMENRVFLLAGGSKIGLAALRTGLIVHPPYLSEQIARSILSRNFCVSGIAIEALKSVFPASEELVRERNEHLKRMNEQHRFSGLLLESLINGIDTVPLNTRERQEMVEIVARAREVDHKDAEQILQTGIPQIRATIRPKSGFFLLVSFKEMQGSCYSDQKNGIIHKLTAIEDDRDIYRLLYNRGEMHAISGRSMGLSADDMMMRITYSFPPEKIVEIAQRLDEIQKSAEPMPEIVSVALMALQHFRS